MNKKPNRSLRSAQSRKKNTYNIQMGLKKSCINHWSKPSNCLTNCLTLHPLPRRATGRHVLPSAFVGERCRRSTSRLGLIGTGIMDFCGDACRRRTCSFGCGSLGSGLRDGVRTDPRQQRSGNVLHASCGSGTTVVSDEVDVDVGHRSRGAESAWASRNNLL